MMSEQDALEVEDFEGLGHQPDEVAEDLDAAELDFAAIAGVPCSVLVAC